jgi:hypothetical protein
MFVALRSRKRFREVTVTSSKIVIALGLVSAINSVSCEPLSRPMTEREQTAAVGGIVGGASGALIGSLVGSAVTGGLHGMPLGALAGYFVGDRMAQDDRRADSRLEESTKEIEWLRRENERLRNLLDYLRADSTVDGANRATVAALPAPIDPVLSAHRNRVSAPVSESAAISSGNSSCMGKPVNAASNGIDFSAVSEDVGVFELTQDTGVGARWRHDFWCFRVAAALRDLAGKSAGSEEAMARLRREHGGARQSIDSSIAAR